MTFPVTFPIGSFTLPAHAVFESLGYFLGFRTYVVLRRRWGDAIHENTRWSVIAAAAVGALIGARLLAFAQHALDPGAPGPLAALSGKTIVGGLLGGWIAVEAVKRAVGETRSTGDLFALPLAIGIALGRVGCFLAGLTDGTPGNPTRLPWGIDFGDGVRRHPAALYEIAALAAIGAWVWSRQRDTSRADGDLFRGFLALYLAFRFVLEWWKPEPRPWAGLTAIQIACVAGVAFLAPHLPRVLGGARRV